MSRYQPALLGGLFIGVLSALPVVSAANMCCCLWVVVGGVLTAYLQQQARPVPLEASEAALGGVVAGVVGAVINITVMGLLLSGAMGAQLVEQLRSAIDQNPQVPVEMRDRFTTLLGSGGFVVIVAAVTVPVYAVFGMLGSLLGLAMFKKKPPTAPGADSQWIKS
jgi:hypothetical protein